MEQKMINANNRRVLAYGGIVFVIFIWGLYPVLTDGLLDFYSGSMFSFTASLFSALALLLLCLPKLKLLNASYFKVAVPTGVFAGLACLLQKIGLPYTTPTQYAFLENLSCVVVPILLFLFIRKKPSALTIGASVLCLVGCFILSKPDFSGGGLSFSFGTGEILCALAGAMYGVNIAATGVYAKKMNAMLYVMIQMWVNVAVSGFAAFLLNRWEVGGVPMEAFRFSWNPKHLLCLAALALAISTLGWIIRTEAMKYVNPSVVAVLMPFSAVVTGVFSILNGGDSFSYFLLFGGLIILISSILSSIDDVRDSRSPSEEATENGN